MRSFLPMGSLTPAETKLLAGTKRWFDDQSVLAPGATARAWAGVIGASQFGTLVHNLTIESTVAADTEYRIFIGTKRLKEVTGYLEDPTTSRLRNVGTGASDRMTAGFRASVRTFKAYWESTVGPSLADDGFIFGAAGTRFTGPGALEVEGAWYLNRDDRLVVACWTPGQELARVRFYGLEFNTYDEQDFFRARML